MSDEPEPKPSEDAPPQAGPGEPARQSAAESVLWIPTEADSDEAIGPLAEDIDSPASTFKLDDEKPVPDPPRPEPELKFLDEPPLRPEPAQPQAAQLDATHPGPRPSRPRANRGRDGRGPDEDTIPAGSPPVDPLTVDRISLVIPVLNEKDSLRALHAEIAEVARGLVQKVEIIFIDDGSTDGSWAIIQQLAEKDERVYGIKFRRNFGKAAALSAGFAATHGGVVITMDADLQDDPKEIPRFLAQLETGLDVVSGWKQVRLDPWHKVFPSRIFNSMVGVVTGVHLHDHNCGMKAYRAAVLREVHLYGEMHRFVPVLAAGRGFRVGELVIKHRPRKFGISKYGWRRFVKGFLDLLTVRFLTGFGRRPQHLLGSFGLVNWALGMFGLVVLVLNAFVRWIGGDVGFGASAQTIIAMLSLGAFLLGTQLLTAGLLSELFIARGLVDSDEYSVSARTEPIDL